MELLFLYPGWMCPMLMMRMLQRYAASTVLLVPKPFRGRWQHWWTDAWIAWAGIAQWLEHRTGDRKVAGSNPCRSGGRIFFSRVNFLCWLISVSVPPRVTTVACKRPRSFCQKCRWQVTAKHAYTLRMWLCMQWPWCMVVWCTQNVPRWQQFHVAPAMPAL